jgi:hypothetical protein
MRLLLSLALSGILLALPRASFAQDLAPPPPMSPTDPQTPQQQSTAQNLDEGEKKNTGRGLEFVWLNAEVGGSYINMEQFSSSTFGLAKSSSGGAMFGLGAGIRLLVFTIGARARLHELSVFNLWQVDGEAGVHIPLGHLDPYITLHAGYSFVGTFGSDAFGTPALPGNSAPAASPNVSVHGVNAGVSIGFDYYFNHFLSIGVDGTADALFLKRPPVALPAGLTAADVMLLPAQEQQLYNNSGDSVGFGLNASAHLGVHF